MNTDRSTDTSSDKPEDNSAYLDIDSTCIVGGDDISCSWKTKRKNLPRTRRSGSISISGRLRAVGRSGWLAPGRFHIGVKMYSARNAAGKGGAT